MCTLHMFLVWLLSRDSGVSFTEAQPGSIFTALCTEIAYHIFSYKTRGYYFFTRPSIAGIIRTQVLLEG